MSNGKKESEERQEAAYNAHLRGKKALDEGDIQGAFASDDEARDLALEAMFLRMKGQ